MPRICPCGKRTSFNILGETKSLCCSKCKTDDMVDVVKIVNDILITHDTRVVYIGFG